METVEIEDFFGVYLLVSKSQNPKFADRTYIGYTVDPNRRIKQHNSGQDGGGAKRTSNRGPWIMVMIIHGFPNNISALRFEWAWQQPKVSRRLKQIPELQKKQRKESSLDYNFRILTEMLRIGPWNRLPLTVRWLVDEYHREFVVGKAPPMHMPICFGRVKKVPKKKTTCKSKQKIKTSQTNSINGKTKENIDYDCDLDEYDLLVEGTDAGREGVALISRQDESDDKLLEDNDESLTDCVICSKTICVDNNAKSLHLRCLQPRCKLICHIECLSERCLEPGQYVPIEGDCPICDCHFLWGNLIRKANGCSDLIEDLNNTNAFVVEYLSESDGE
ncbi:structure-specific endonuclease subunit SLX1 homolog [Toxorhynchites rutilus septentrionalis]|uniref:structure-specific endonuclease subunit SLX1 homolog n=1 Tax=Toxorhynchites rutilus septentrionalis TaxID=329112 RepID=UPI00247893D1|nr:structure-specific endonuclease subunit SLX1 homolog [Toxorhynchites rutilus septentrionalis]